MDHEGKRYIQPFDDFKKDIEVIGEWAKLREFLNVYGIIRGGITPAIFLSYYLDIPFLCPTEVDRITRNTLVVDDLIDTGNTIILLQNRLGFIPIVSALFVAPDANPKPVFAVRPKKEWIQFLWETGETSKYDGTFRKFLEAHPK